MSGLRCLMLALYVLANIYTTFVFGVDEITERTLCSVLESIIYNKNKILEHVQRRDKE